MANEITPSRLKGLAGAMGKEVTLVTFIDDRKAICIGPYNVQEELNHWYQPHKDWNQCGEVWEWFIKQIGPIDAWYWILQTDMAIKDFKTAITLAALAYVESKND